MNELAEWVIAGASDYGAVQPILCSCNGDVGSAATKKLAERGDIFKTHANLVGNVVQIASHIALDPAWVMFNPLPTFHCFGLTGGVLRGLASGGACFVRLYVLQLGMLCGAQGFLYCLFVSLESFFRYAALRYDQGRFDDVVKRT